MAVSDSKNFELDVTEYIEEAYERCGLEVRTGYDLKTAKRSLNLMLADWANRGLNRWTMAQTTQSITAGTANYTLGIDNPIEHYLLDGPYYLKPCLQIQTIA